MLRQVRECGISRMGGNDAYVAVLALDACRFIYNVEAQVYVHPCDSAPPASKYFLRQTAKAAHRTGPLSSSFANTPRVMRAVLRRPPPRRPATELLEKAVWRDYLGVIPNPGYEPNSLLFGRGKAAYEVRHAKSVFVFYIKSSCS